MHPGQVHERGAVWSVDYKAEGVSLRARVPRDLLCRVEPFRVGGSPPGAAERKYWAQLGRGRHILMRPGDRLEGEGAVEAAAPAPVARDDADLDFSFRREREKRPEPPRSRELGLP